MMKRRNNIVQLQNKEFLSITHIILINTAFQNKQLCILLGLKLHSTSEFLYRSRVIDITSNSIFSIVEETHELIAIYPQMMYRKCVITPYANDARKFCCFPLVNSIETD